MMTSELQPTDDYAAELLDQYLCARRDWLNLPGEDEAGLNAAVERERQAADQLLALDTSAPAVLLAQLVAACTEQTETLFEDQPAAWLDFEAVPPAVEAETSWRMPLLLSRCVCALLRNCAESPVAAVVARYRTLAQQDARFEKSFDHAFQPAYAAAEALRKAGDTKLAMELEDGFRTFVRTLAVDAGAWSESQDVAAAE
jgi:HPt (histidine-containing phosphotransfer) domain-containing protein